MPSCALRYCKNTTKNINKTDGVTFHRFPRPDHPQREKWIKFVQEDRREEFWLPSEASRICSDHFKEGDVYTTKNNRRFLRSTAVPCIQVTEVCTAATSDSRPVTPLSDTYVSDSESIFDTPKEIRLKHQLKKNFEIRKLQSKKIKKLQRQRRNLIKKVMSLSNIIKNLKERNKIKYEIISTLKKYRKTSE